jgi:hypothetical protein
VLTITPQFEAAVAATAKLDVKATEDAQGAG